MSPGTEYLLVKQAPSVPLSYVGAYIGSTGTGWMYLKTNPMDLSRMDGWMDWRRQQLLPPSPPRSRQSSPEWTTGAERWRWCRRRRWCRCFPSMSACPTGRLQFLSTCRVCVRSLEVCVCVCVCALMRPSRASCPVPIHAVRPSQAQPKPKPRKDRYSRGRWGRREIADTVVAQATLRISYQQSAPGYAMQLLLGQLPSGRDPESPEISLLLWTLFQLLLLFLAGSPHRIPSHTAKGQSLPCLSESVPDFAHRDRPIVIWFSSSRFARLLLLLLLTTI